VRPWIDPADFTRACGTSSYVLLNIMLYGSYVMINMQEQSKAVREDLSKLVKLRSFLSLALAAPRTPLAEEGPDGLSHASNTRIPRTRNDQTKRRLGCPFIACARKGQYRSSDSTCSRAKSEKESGVMGSQLRRSRICREPSR
jgi:hypothetical protein